MTTKSDDGTTRTATGRYDLPSGNYEIIETDVIGGVASGSSQVRRFVATYRPSYLNEDETVLACCHHAHEVAKAHGAREVMLEHLVHALVRVPDAANAVQDRGINVESLKRESAAVISSEIPVDHTMMIAQLRASKDFNTVMHLAAAAASRRDERTLGVRDLMDALLRYDPKSRVVRMLRRHAVDGELDEPVDPLSEIKGVLDRYASEARDLRLAISDLRSNRMGESVIGALEDRLRGMERMLSSLGAESGAERSSFLDRVKSLSDTLAAHRNDTRVVADRLQSLERLVAGGGTGGNGQLHTLVGDRFLSIQKTIDNHRLDLARLEQGMSEQIKGLAHTLDVRALASPQVEGLTTRLAALEAAVLDRLKALEGRLAAQPTAASPALDGILERLKALDGRLSGQAAGPGMPLDGVLDRMQAMERQFAAQRSELQSWQTSLSQDMRALQVTLGAARTGDIGSGASNDQILGLHSALEGQRADVEAGLTERHRALERLLDSRLAGLSSISGLADRLVAVERAIAGQRSDTAGAHGELDLELEHIRKAMLALGNAQQTLSSAIDEWRQNNSGDLSVISNRLAALEKLTGPIERIASVATLATAAPQAPQSNGAPAAAVQIVPAQSAPATVQVGNATAYGGQPSSGLLDRVDRALAGRYNS